MTTRPAPMSGNRIRSFLSCLQSSSIPGPATAIVLLFLLPALVQAQRGQDAQPPGFADFGQWESLSRAGSRGGFSPDGRWIAYGINRTNREN